MGSFLGLVVAVAVDSNQELCAALACSFGMGFSWLFSWGAAAQLRAHRLDAT